MRRTSAVTATLLTVALVFSSVELTATTVFAQEPAAADSLAQAKALNEQAEIKFQTADYEEALDLWKQAYAIVPDSDDTRTIRNALVYNIAEAHSRAYEISRNPTHLRKAKILLENYQRDNLALYGDDPAAIQERADAGDRIAELDRKLTESEAKGEVASPLDNGPEPTPAVGPAPAPVAPAKPLNLTPKQRWEEDVKADPILGPKWEKGRSQVAGGAVLTGVGSLFLIGTVGMVAWGASLRSSFNNCDPTGIDSGLFCDTLDGTGAFVTGGVLGVIALSLTAPGIALLVVGSKKRADVKTAKPPPVSMAPYLDLRNGAGGVTAQIRF